MSASAYFEKAMLDWVCGGATPTQPPGNWCALAIGTPSSKSNAGSEMGTLTGYARLTVSFGPASTGAGSSASCSNNGAMTFGPFSSVGSVLGITLWDASPVGSTNMLWYNTLAFPRTIGVGDTLVIGAGALTLTLV